MCRECWNYDGGQERGLLMASRGEKGWEGWQRSPWPPVTALVPSLLCAESLGVSEERNSTFELSLFLRNPYSALLLLPHKKKSPCSSKLLFLY